MTLFARSDLMSVAVPVASGGCGTTHTRPVRNGVASKTWRLDCQPCETFLKGGGRTRLQYSPGDKETGLLPRQERVADSDPCWSATEESVPDTPDEMVHVRRRKQLGEQELEMIKALAAAKAAGIDIPVNAAWLLERNFDSRILKGTTECPDGHENTSGSQFCSSCGLPMAGRVPKAELSAPEPVKKSLRELRAMCQSAGLPEYGTKAQIMERLGIS